jgi:hypothetical protein
MSALELQRKLIDEELAKAKRDLAGKKIDEARFKEIKESYKQADLYLKNFGE